MRSRRRPSGCRSPCRPGRPTGCRTSCRPSSRRPSGGCCRPRRCGRPRGRGWLRALSAIPHQLALPLTLLPLLLLLLLRLLPLPPLAGFVGNFLADLAVGNPLAAAFRNPEALLTWRGLDLSGLRIRLDLVKTHVLAVHLRQQSHGVGRGRWWRGRPNEAGR